MHKAEEIETIIDFDIPSEVITELDDEIDQALESETVQNLIIEQNATDLGIQQTEEKVRLILDVDGLLVAKMPLPYNAKTKQEQEINDRFLRIAPYTEFAKNLSRRIDSNPDLYDAVVITGRKKISEEHTYAMLKCLLHCPFTLITMPDIIPYDPKAVYVTWKISQILFNLGNCKNEIYDDDLDVYNASLAIVKLNYKHPVTTAQVKPEELNLHDTIHRFKSMNELKDANGMFDLVEHYQKEGVMNESTAKIFAGIIANQGNPFIDTNCLTLLIKDMKKNGYGRLYYCNNYTVHSYFDKLWEKVSNEQ